ncbi:hypothetical protein HAX54_008719 [Datura stramonium]|uniref:Uncharacterized protein n=1 Tax=Datura stramonium TaxID=4076 RepID=A0ABS8RVR1_DATST|nr:hypothetical protein [Datura stramonium]
MKSRTIDELVKFANDSRPRFMKRGPETKCGSMTSRRTSYPRTGKQSDPTDKGKGKEKRPAEEEAESGSDSELEKSPLIPPGRYYPTLVYEFYASYGVVHKHQKAIGPLRSRPFLEKVKISGIEIDCSVKAINWAYFDDDDVDATNYLAKLENPENHYTWIASLIEAEIHINVGDIISTEIRDRARQEHTSLPFPMLVKNICRDTTDLGIDSQVEHSQAAEAKLLNSDTPVVPQSAQSISATRMVQVANMTAWNNTRLTLLIGHMPDTIKRAIDNALAPVHVKIQDLEHRPDLSIFDAPLLEDQGFDDERVETYEEELEDDHVKKELDEERKVEVVVQCSMDDSGEEKDLGENRRKTKIRVPKERKESNMEEEDLDCKRVAFREVPCEQALDLSVSHKPAPIPSSPV